MNEKISPQEKAHTEILQIIARLKYVSPLGEVCFLSKILKAHISSQQDWMQKMSLEEAKKIIFTGEKQ